MSMFLLMFLLIYGGMHAVFLFAIKDLIPPGKLVHGIIFVTTLFLILAPVICRMLEHSGHDLAASVIGYIGYYWMGFVLISLTFSVPASIYHIIIFVYKHFSGAGGSGSPSGGFIAYGVIFISFWLSVWAVFEASNIRIEHLTVETEKIESEAGRVRIVMISDVHLGLLSRESKIREIVDQIQALQPDIVINAGDFIDGSTSHVEGLTRLFRVIDAPMGKFAVLGNHEFYRGTALSVTNLRNAGFKVLRDEKIRIKGNIAVIGEDDRHYENRKPIRPLLNNAPADDFTILIKHRPEVDERLVGRFDLQLSGHSHGGQIFPFTIPVHMRYRYARGYHEIGGGSAVYTSRGTGLWGPPMRLGSPPEITIIDLEKKSSPVSPDEAP